MTKARSNTVLLSLLAAALLTFNDSSVAVAQSGADLAPGSFVEGLAAWQRGEALEAFEIWTPLADQNDAEAQYGLGLLLENGGEAVPADPAKAALWYERAAEGGIIEARTNLGLLYAQGKGVENSPARASELWTRAAQDGHNMAQFNLGLARYSGSGLLQDLDEAVGLIYAAAAADLPEAQFALGQFFRLGLGLEKSETEAYYWFTRAQALGNENAKPFVEAFAERGLTLPAAADRDNRPAVPETLVGTVGAALWTPEVAPAAPVAQVQSTASGNSVTPETTEGGPAPATAAMENALAQSLSPIPKAPTGLGSQTPRGTQTLGPRVTAPLSSQQPSQPRTPRPPVQRRPVQRPPVQQPQSVDMSQFPAPQPLIDIPAGESLGLLWGAWLGTTDSRSALERLWLELIPRQPDILTQIQPGIQTVRIGGKTYYRLLGGPFPSKSVAWQVCNAIKIANPDLFCKARVIE